MKNKLTHEADIEFDHKGKHYQFKFHHNIPQPELQPAFENWLIRTDTISAESFANYVNNKGVHKVKVIEQL